MDENSNVMPFCVIAFLGLVFTLAMLTINLRFIAPVAGL